MAKTLSNTGITDGQLARAAQVTQSIDALTGGDAYDITISGSLTVTGSTALSGNLAIPGFPDVSASLALAGGSTDSFPFSGSAEITGSLLVTGSTKILASEESDLTFEINQSASFEFLTGGPNSGSFIVQTSPDTGKGEIQTFFGQGTAVVASQNIPNQIFGVKYTSGSGASQGELTMTLGKRDLTNLGSTDLNNFFVAYEPSGILTNAEGELEFHLGDHFKVGNGIVLEYRGGASGTTQTSSYAGYFSSSAFPNQQQYTRPFVISTLTQVNDTNPAFVVNKNIDHPTESKFSVDYGGNVVASGNVSASGDVFGVTGSFSHLQGNSPITVGDIITFQQPVTASGNISASGNLFGQNIYGGTGGRIYPDSSQTSNNQFFTANANGIYANTGLEILGNITASNISASGTMIMLTASIGGGIFTSASLAAGGGSTPTLQEVMDQGSSTTTPITASIVSASGDLEGAGLKVDGAQIFEFASILNLQSGSVATDSNAVIRSSLERLLVNSAGGWKTFEVLNTTNFSVHEDGHVTASGNISASSQIVGNSFKVQQQIFGGTDTSLIISGSTFDGDNRDAQIIYPNHGLHFNSNNSDNHVLALAGNNVGIRKQPDDGNALQISGSISMVEGDIFGVTNITASRNISASSQLFCNSIVTNDGISMQGNVFDYNGTDLRVKNTGLEVLSGHITASGNISSSGAITGDTVTTSGNITSGDRIIATGRIIGSSTVQGTEGIFTAGVNTTHVTASGNISASGNFIGNGLQIEGASSIKIDSETSGMEIFGNQIEMGGRDESKLIIINGLNGSGTGRVFIGDSEGDWNGSHLDIQVGKNSAHFIDMDVTGSGHGFFQAGKPIVTHTSSPISSSKENAGKYHIVGGNLTASIVISNTTPVGAEYEFFQSSSAGQFLFESASGTTVISKNGSMRLAQQGSSAVLKKVSTTTFHLMGDLT